MDKPEERLDKAFFETDDPELRAFGERQTARKVVTLVVMLAAMLLAGIGVGWAIYASLR